MLNEAFSIQTVHGLKTFYPVSINPTDFSKPVRTKMKHWGTGWSAQIFVGLSVRGKPRWNAEQIRNRVIEIRREQLGGAGHGGSVTPMLGYWESKGSGSGDPRENSVSVMIENMGDEQAYMKKEYSEEERRDVEVASGTFVWNMTNMAKQLVAEFEQESVILRILKANVVQDIIEVSTENY